MKGRPAKLTFTNTPNVTLNNDYIFTKDVSVTGDVTINGSLKLDSMPAVITQDAAVFTSDVTVAGGLEIAGTFDTSKIDTFNALVTMAKGIDVTTDGVVITSGGIMAADAGLTISNGDLTVSDNIIIGKSVTVETGDITATLGSIVSNGSIRAAQGITTESGLYVTKGNVEVQSGDVNVTSGDVTITGDVAVEGTLSVSTAVVASLGFVATGGGCTVTAGGVEVTAGDVLVSKGNVILASGDITAGIVSANEKVVVYDSASAPHEIYANKDGNLMYDSIQLTNGPANMARGAFTTGIDTTDQDIFSRPGASGSITTIELLLHGTEAGKVVIVKVYASFNHTDPIGTPKVVIISDTDGIDPVFTSRYEGKCYIVKATQAAATVHWVGEAYVVETF